MQDLGEGVDGYTGEKERPDRILLKIMAAEPLLGEVEVLALVVVQPGLPVLQGDLDEILLIQALHCYL